MMRLVVILALTAALVAAVPAAGGAQPAGASLIVHARLCPTGYVANAFFADCHDDPAAGYRYTLAGPETATAKTDAAGNVTFAALAPGTYTVGDRDTPGHFIDRLVVFCAPAASPGTAFPFVATSGTARLDLAVGDAVVCDFYYVFTDARALTPATLTIHNRLCPAGFPGPVFYNACHGTPAPAGLEFALAGPDSETASTDAKGNTAFKVAAGRYEVRGGVPGEFATLRVFCAPATRPATPFPFVPLAGGVRGPNDLTGVALVLAAGDAVVCDWYNTPESGV